MFWLPEYFVAGIMYLALLVYMLTGGADFGGGVWDLLATGPRANEQRKLISQAIAPIWEANHVWLIIVVVLMFVCFPSAFATVTTALHIPLTIMLIGIVLRGSAFVFRSHDADDARVQRRWSVIFAIGSIITPIMLGASLGALTSGRMLAKPNKDFVASFVSPWFAPFPLAIGVLTLALCAFLAAVYLIFETDNSELKADFRKRALIAAILLGVVAGTTIFFAKNGAPRIFDGLLREPWSVPLQIATGISAITAIIALAVKRDRLARISGAAQVICVMSGWALAQFPYLIVASHTIRDSAAPHSILRPVLIALGVGAIALVPSYGYLYFVFKGGKGVQPTS